MSTHSPGPWSFEVEENGDEFRLSDVNNEVVVGGCGCCGSPWCSLADARLIAAAPDLLGALQFIAEHDLSGADPEAAAQIVNVFIYKARAAIARATGDSQ